ncbi:MAG: hypothetical protein ACTSV7_06655 [Candidatus Baldrarchaeia archaeon]
MPDLGFFPRTLANQKGSVLLRSGEKFAKRIADNLGIRYRGVQEGAGGVPAGHLFDDELIGSFMTKTVDDLSPKIVEDLLMAKRAQFGLKIPLRKPGSMEPGEAVSYELARKQGERAREQIRQQNLLDEVRRGAEGTRGPRLPEPQSRTGDVRRLAIFKNLTNEKVIAMADDFGYTGSYDFGGILREGVYGDQFLMNGEVIRSSAIKNLLKKHGVDYKMQESTNITGVRQRQIRDEKAPTKKANEMRLKEKQSESRAMAALERERKRALATKDLEKYKSKSPLHKEYADTVFENFRLRLEKLGENVDKIKSGEAKGVFAMKGKISDDLMEAVVKDLDPFYGLNEKGQRLTDFIGNDKKRFVNFLASALITPLQPGKGMPRLMLDAAQVRSTLQKRGLDYELFADVDAAKDFSKFNKTLNLSLDQWFTSKGISFEKRLLMEGTFPFSGRHLVETKQSKITLKQYKEDLLSGRIKKERDFRRSGEFRYSWEDFIKGGEPDPSKYFAGGGMIPAFEGGGSFSDAWDWIKNPEPGSWRDPMGEKAASIRPNFGNLKRSFFDLAMSSQAAKAVGETKLGKWVKNVEPGSWRDPTGLGTPRSYLDYYGIREGKGFGGISEGLGEFKDLVEGKRLGLADEIWDQGILGKIGNVGQQGALFVTQLATGLAKGPIDLLSMLQAGAGYAVGTRDRSEITEALKAFSELSLKDIAGGIGTFVTEDVKKGGVGITTAALEILSPLTIHKYGKFIKSPAFYKRSMGFVQEAEDYVATATTRLSKKGIHMPDIDTGVIETSNQLKAYKRLVDEISSIHEQYPYLSGRLESFDFSTGDLNSMLGYAGVYSPPETLGTNLGKIWMDSKYITDPIAARLMAAEKPGPMLKFLNKLMYGRGPLSTLHHETLGHFKSKELDFLVEYIPRRKAIIEQIEKKLNELDPEGFRGLLKKQKIGPLVKEGIISENEVELLLSGLDQEKLINFFNKYESLKTDLMVQQHLAGKGMASVGKDLPERLAPGRTGKLSIRRQYGLEEGELLPVAFEEPATAGKFYTKTGKLLEEILEDEDKVIPLLDKLSKEKLFNSFREQQIIRGTHYENPSTKLFASGGRIFGEGGPTEDKVPALVSPGEYVVKASSAKQIGYNALDFINQRGAIPAFQAGGAVAGSEKRGFNPGKRDILYDWIGALETLGVLYLLSTTRRRSTEIERIPYAPLSEKAGPDFTTSAKLEDYTDMLTPSWSAGGLVDRQLVGDEQYVMKDGKIHRKVKEPDGSIKLVPITLARGGMVEDEKKKYRYVNRPDGTIRKILVPRFSTKADGTVNEEAYVKATANLLQKTTESEKDNIDKTRSTVRFETRDDLKTSYSKPGKITISKVGVPYSGAGKKGVWNVSDSWAGKEAWLKEKGLDESQVNIQRGTRPEPVKKGWREVGGWRTSAITGTPYLTKWGGIDTSTEKDPSKINLPGIRRTPEGVFTDKKEETRGFPAIEALIKAGKESDIVKKFEEPDAIPPLWPEGMDTMRGYSYYKGKLVNTAEFIERMTARGYKFPNISMPKKDAMKKFEEPDVIPPSWQEGMDTLSEKYRLGTSKTQQEEMAGSVANMFQEESAFQKWYGGVAEKYSLNENPRHPEHYYDYKSAYQFGIRGPGTDGHWDSMFKTKGHPRTVVGGIDTRTGRRVGSETLGILGNEIFTTEKTKSIEPDLLKGYNFTGPMPDIPKGAGSEGGGSGGAGAGGPFAKVGDVLKIPKPEIGIEEIMGMLSVENKPDDYNIPIVPRKIRNLFNFLDEADFPTIFKGYKNLYERERKFDLFRSERNYPKLLELIEGEKTPQGADAPGKEFDALRSEPGPVKAIPHAIREQVKSAVAYYAEAQENLRKAQKAKEGFWKEHAGVRTVKRKIGEGEQLDFERAKAYIPALAGKTSAGAMGLMQQGSGVKTQNWQKYFNITDPNNLPTLHKRGIAHAADLPSDINKFVEGFHQTHVTAGVLKAQLEKYAEEGVTGNKWETTLKTYSGVLRNLVEFERLSKALQAGERPFDERTTRDIQAGPAEGYKPGREHLKEFDVSKKGLGLRLSFERLLYGSPLPEFADESKKIINKTTGIFRRFEKTQMNKMFGEGFKAKVGKFAQERDLTLNVERGLLNIYYDIFSSYKNKLGPMMEGMRTGIDPLGEIKPSDDLSDPATMNRLVRTLGMALGGKIPSLDEGGIVTQGGIAQVATGEMFSMDGFSGLKDIVSEFQRILSDAKIEIKDTKVKLDTDTIGLDATDAIVNLEAALSDVTLGVDREPLPVEELKVDATEAVTAIESALSGITVDVNREPLTVEEVTLKVEDTTVQLDATSLEGIVLEVNRDPLQIDATSLEGIVLEVNREPIPVDAATSLEGIVLEVNREPLPVEDLTIDAGSAVTAIESAFVGITVDVNRDPLPVENVTLKVDSTPLQIDTTSLEGIVLEVNREPIPVDATTIEIGEVKIDTASITTAITSALTNTPLAVGGESEAAKSLATIVEGIKDKVIDLVDWQVSTDANMITRDNISEFVDTKIADSTSFIYAEMNKTLASRQDEIRLSFTSAVNSLQVRIERAEQEINRTKSLAMSQNLGTV